MMNKIVIKACFSFRHVIVIFSPAFSTEEFDPVLATIVLLFYALARSIFMGAVACIWVVCLVLLLGMAFLLEDRVDICIKKRRKKKTRRVKKLL